MTSPISGGPAPGDPAAAQPRHLAAPQQAPAELRALTAPAPLPAFARPRSLNTGALVALIVAFVIIGFALLLTLAYYVWGLGPGLVFVGALLALVPLAIVLLGVRWIDRWEPEPRVLLAIGVLWGATVVILSTLVIVTVFDVTWAEAGLSEDQIDYLGSVWRAPIIEEFGKGLGVLLIYLFARRWFDGPVDGIVYAAVVAAGFAFTENIQYFAIQASAGDGLAFTFFIRGIMAPFGHVMYTACTGFAIGLAARRGTVGPAILAFFVGLVPAILLHMLWNGGLSLVSSDAGFFGFYFLIQVPLFALAVLGVVLVKRHEVSLTRARLSEYAEAGWINPSEVQSIATPAGRRAALAWASAHGLRKLMKTYIRDATELAYTRQRIISRRDRRRDIELERDLLERISSARRVLLPGG